MTNRWRTVLSSLQGKSERRALHLVILGVVIITVIAGVRLRERLMVPEVVEPLPLIVEVERATAAPLVVSNSYSGSLEADRRATLSARVASTVKARYVMAGDVVEQGQQLLRLDAAELHSELLRLQAAAERIRADVQYWQGQFKVDRNLFAKGSISERKLQETMRQVATANALLEENRHAQAIAETRLAYTNIVAPFAGVVQAMMVEEGEAVNPGSPLLELVDPTTLKAVISAPQIDRQRLAPGLRVYLHLHQLATALQGEIRHIYPALDSLSRNLTFDVPVHSEDASTLHAGMSVQAVVELEHHASAIMVPMQAVQQRKGGDGVFSAQEGYAVWLPVTTGDIHGHRVQLMAGVGENELVITTPNPALAPGSAVEIYQGEEPMRFSSLKE